MCGVVVQRVHRQLLAVEEHCLGNNGACGGYEDTQVVGIGCAWRCSAAMAIADGISVNQAGGTLLLALV